MKRRFCRWISLLACIAFILPSQVSATKYTADFLTKGTGARPLAMGGAFTAVGDDTNTLFFNPGALGLLGGSSFTLMHSERFGGLVQVDHGAFHRAIKVKGRDASIGISILRVGVEDILFTGSPEDHGWEPEFDGDEFELADLEAMEIDPSLFRTVSDQEWGILGVYSMRRGNWSYGGAIKVIYQSVGEFNSFGFGLDAGMITPRFWRGLRAGLKIQDITGTFLAWSTGVSEMVPPSLRPGLSWQHNFAGLDAAVLLAADAEIRFENYQEAATWSAGSLSVDPHAGLELWLLRAVALRVGLDRDAWSAGGGLRLISNGGILPWDFLDDISLDYAFGNHEDLDGSHRLGLGVRF
jgi:hypothetical protein